MKHLREPSRRKSSLLESTSTAAALAPFVAVSRPGSKETGRVYSPAVETPQVDTIAAISEDDPASAVDADGEVFSM